MTNELWGVGRTFILVALAIVGAVVLIAVGKMPVLITTENYTLMMGTLIGIYATKSIGHTYVTNKKTNGTTPVTPGQ